MQPNSGFSLVEIVVVVGIFSLLGTVSITMYIEYKNKTAFTLAQAEVTQLINTATLNARSGVGDTDWSLYTKDNHVTLFSGNDYTLRDPENDTVLTLTNETIVSGPEMLTFSQVSGFPDSGGLYTVHSGGTEVIITINEYGTVEVK